MAERRAEELGKLQVQIHLDKSVKLKGKLKDLHHKMDQVRERLEGAQSETHKLEQEEKGQRAQLNEIEQELAGVREQAYKAASEVEVTQGRVEGTRRHRNMLADQKQRNEQQVAEALSRIEQLKTWVSERLQLFQNKASQKKEKDDLKVGLAEKLSALDGDLSARNQDLETKNAAAMDLVKKAAQMKAELESLKSQDEETSRRVGDLAAQVDRLQRQLGRPNKGSPRSTGKRIPSNRKKPNWTKASCSSKAPCPTRKPRSTKSTPT